MKEHVLYVGLVPSFAFPIPEYSYVYRYALSSTVYMYLAYSMHVRYYLERISVSGDPLANGIDRRTLGITMRGT